MSLNNENFSPGGKNWLIKYLELVDREIIDLETTDKNDFSTNSLEVCINKTGLLFGACSSLIYSKSLDIKRFTKDENLKLLLFETLIFTYKKEKKNFDKNLFLETLAKFYQDIKLSQFRHWSSFFAEETTESKIERILNDRVKVKTNFFGTNYWLNHLSNSFVFLDVILFHKFLKNEISSFFEIYEETAFTVIKALTYAAYLDKQVEEKEQRMLWHFLSCADLEKEQKEFCEQCILNGIEFNETSLESLNDLTVKKIIFELSIFVTKSKHITSGKEDKKIIDFGSKIGLTEKEIHLSFVLCNSYLLENSDELALLNAESNTQFVYKAFSKRWFKILGRNKDKLIKELKESKELVSLIQKSTKEELTKEEKDQVKNQFLDLLKSMPSMAIFLLPGGALLLPLILKIVPDLLPSAFKENDIEK